MSDSSLVPPGWYPDGSGDHRYWDGAGWTEHVHRGTETAAEAPARPAGPAPAGRRTQARSADRSRSGRVRWAAAAAVLVLGAGAVGFAVLRSGGDSAAAPPVAARSGAAPASGAVPSGSPVTYGAAPAVVASVAGCTDVRDPEASEEASPVSYRRITCTIGTAVVKVDTYPAATDQGIAENALVQYLGDGRYASGEGWIAIDDSQSAQTAQVFARALGGTVKGS